VNFTTALADANYSTVGTCSITFGNIVSAPYSSTQTVNSIRVSTSSATPTLTDMSTVSIQVFGN